MAHTALASRLVRAFSPGCTTPIKGALLLLLAPSMPIAATHRRRCCCYIGLWHPPGCTTPIKDPLAPFAAEASPPLCRWLIIAKHRLASLRRQHVPRYRSASSGSLWCHCSQHPCCALAALATARLHRRMMLCTPDVSCALCKSLLLCCGPGSLRTFEYACNSLTAVCTTVLCRSACALW